MDSVNPKDLVGSKKAPLSVVPESAVIAMSDAMKNGADKYGAFNWRSIPVEAMTYVEAAKRHIAAWVDGEDLAEDSGVHHLHHAMATLAILIDSKEMGILKDNRPPQGPSAHMLRERDNSSDQHKAVFERSHDL